MSRLGLGVGQKRYPNLYSRHVANGTKYHNIFLEVVTRSTDYSYTIIDTPFLVVLDQDDD